MASRFRDTKQKIIASRRNRTPTPEATPTQTPPQTREYTRNDLRNLGRTLSAQDRATDNARQKLREAQSRQKQKIGRLRDSLKRIKDPQTRARKQAEIKRLRDELDNPRKYPGGPVGRRFAAFERISAQRRRTIQSQPASVRSAARSLAPRRFGPSRATKETPRPGRDTPQSSFSDVRGLVSGTAFVQERGSVQTASVPGPQVRSQPTETVSEAGREAVTPANLPVTSLNIQTLTRQRDAPSRRTQRFEERIAKIEERETRTAQRDEQAANVFRAIPGLRGDNIVQTNVRGLLAFPGRVVTTLPSSAVTAGMKAGATVDALTNPELRPQVGGELRRAGRETPRTVGRSFDPREPEGVSNILIVGGGIVAGGAAAARSPVRTATPKTITVRSVTAGGRTTTTMRGTAPLRGTVNRALGRTARVETIVRPTGTVSQVTTVRNPFGVVRQRVTQRAGQDFSTVRVSSGGKTRSFRSGQTTTTSEFLVAGRRDVQRFQNQMRENVIEQGVSVREAGTLRVSIGREQFSGPVTTRTRAFSQTIAGDTRVTAFETTGTLTQSATRSRTTRIRVGRGERDLVRSANLDPELEIVAGGVQPVTRGVIARTPPPRTTVETTSVTRATLTRQPARVPRLPRRGQVRPSSELISEVVRPTRINTLPRPTTPTPRISAGFRSPSLAGLGLAAAATFARPAVPVTGVLSGQRVIQEPRPAEDVVPVQDQTPIFDQGQLREVVPETRQRQISRGVPLTQTAPGVFSPPVQSPGFSQGVGLGVPLPVVGFGGGPFSRRSRRGGSRGVVSRSAFSVGLEEIEGLPRGGVIVTRTPRGGLFGVESRRSPRGRRSARTTRKKKKTRRRRKR